MNWKTVALCCLLCVPISVRASSLEQPVELYGSGRLTIGFPYEPDCSLNLRSEDGSVILSSSSGVNSGCATGGNVLNPYQFSVASIDGVGGRASYSVGGGLGHIDVYSPDLSSIVLSIQVLTYVTTSYYHEPSPGGDQVYSYSFSPAIPIEVPSSAPAPEPSYSWLAAVMAGGGWMMRARLGRDPVKCRG